MALILLVLGLLGVAVVAVAWWPLPEMVGGAAETRLATATVIESAPCATATKGDLVEVPVDGTKKRARFDGCGHSRGQQLRVRVPVDPGGEFVVRAAEDTEDSGGGELRNRVSWVLATLAAIAGGGYALMLQPKPERPQSTSAGAADQVLH